MEEKKENNKQDLGFLHKICKNASHVSLSYWLTNENFCNEILNLVSNKSCIDEKMVFEIMRNIYLSYESMWENTGSKPDFNFHLARKCITSIWESSTGLKDGWREYQPD